MLKLLNFVISVVKFCELTLLSRDSSELKNDQVLLYLKPDISSKYFSVISCNITIKSALQMYSIKNDPQELIDYIYFKFTMNSKSVHCTSL